MKASGPSIRVARNERTGEMERIICRNRPVRRETDVERAYRQKDQVPRNALTMIRLHDEDDMVIPYTINRDLVPGEANYVKDALTR